MIDIAEKIKNMPIIDLMTKRVIIYQKISLARGI
jgi:hypothetical protein